MKMDFKKSAVARCVNAHPDLRFASSTPSRESIFGSDSPTMQGTGLGRKIHETSNRKMPVSKNHAKVMKAMKFMMNRIGG